MNNGGLTNEYVDNKLIGRNIRRVDNYITNCTKITFECTVCFNTWKAIPSSILCHNTGCPNCRGSKKYNNKTFDEKNKNKKIKRLGDYKNNKIKIDFLCLICNRVWKASPVGILSGYGCPSCGKSEKLNNEIIDRRLKNKNIKRLEDYVNIKTKIKFECLVCNNIWESRPNCLINTSKNTPFGQGCPACNGSKSQKHVENIIKNTVKCDTLQTYKHFYFNDRKYIPDFYLEIKNKKIIIEYNGQQHYYPVRFAGISKYKSEKNLIKQQKRDEELRQYCKENNIFLLEIPYYWKENKIIKELKKLNNYWRL
jgi:hypothetical protein